MDKAREFIDFWMQNSVHSAEQYGTPGGSQRTSDLMHRCVEMAAAQGLSRADLEAEVGNLSEYIRTGLDKANATESGRADRHRNK
jgi:hypothetical protein